MELRPGLGLPAVQPADRFLALAGRYLPDLLHTPVDEASLVSATLAEIGHGAAWVKVIADFPDLAAGTDGEATYQVDAIARVAVHSTVPGTGVDSFEYRWSALDEHAVTDMAGRGTAWTPTIGALVAMLDAPATTPKRRRGFAEGRARVAELLLLAVRLGVQVLAGTDVTGSIPREVALLAQMSLDHKDALATASTWPWRFLGAPATGDIVTHHHDPGQLARPVAVVAGGGVWLR